MDPSTSPDTGLAPAAVPANPPAGRATTAEPGGAPAPPPLPGAGEPPLEPGELADLTAGVYRRGSEEFSRFTGFSDGIFGFAMTLLISTVAVPAVAARELGAALRDQVPDLLAFFVSFAVIGFYWLSHHRLFATFGSVTSRLMRINLAYMALIAFLPFPTALFGRYTEEPASVVLYAAALSGASFVEAAILREARRGGVLRVSLPDDAYRFVVAASLAPVAVFAASALVAFVDVGLAPFVWLLIIPIEVMLGRRSPAPARLFG